MTHARASPGQAPTVAIDGLGSAGGEARLATHHAFVAGGLCPKEELGDREARRVVTPLRKVQCGFAAGREFKKIPNGGGS